MARFDKHGKSAIGHLGKHFERGLGSDGEPVKYNNQAINLDKSHLNFNLAPERNMNHAEYIQQRTSEVHCLNRADVKLLGTWVVTLPKGLEGQERDFFEKTYEFLQKRYGGENNVVSAYVHMDETTPHLHFAFIPIVKDPKKGLKVSMKECVNRKDLQTFHQDLEKELAKTFGREVGILNDATREGNKSIAELKRLSATNEVQKVKQEINTLEQHKNGLQGQIKATEDEFKAISNVKLDWQEINSIQGEFGIISKEKVKVNATDLEKLKEFAGTQPYYKNLAEKFESENTLLKKEQNGLYKQIKTLKEKLSDVEKEFDRYKRSLTTVARYIKSIGKEDEFVEYKNRANEEDQANEIENEQSNKNATQKNSLEMEL